MRHIAWVLAVGTLAACLDTSLPASPLRGRVVGTLDASKGKLSSAGREVVLSGETGVSQTATTDDTGAFVFGDVPPGLYLVTVSLNGYAKATSDLLRVRSGRDTDAGTLTPESLSSSPQVATLVGKVAGKSGQDITGATVQFLYSNVVFDSATLAADGVFRRLLPPGTLTIHVTHPSFITKDLTDVVLDAAETKDLTAQPLVLDVNPATLSGTVLRERDGQTPEPASSAAVQLVPGDNAIVDPAGQFLVGGQQGGAHRLVITQAGYHDSESSRTVTLEAGAATTLEPITLLLDRGTIVGTVRLADGSPVSGARVEVVGTNYAALVSPDPVDPSQGGFVMAGVPVGTWSVVARKDQYSNSSTSVVVVKDLPVASGVLTLARLFGDFSIDDADSLNTPGYTRTLAVQLDLSGFPTTGVATWRASEDATFTNVSFAPYTGRHQPFTLTTGDGPHTVFAQYTDSAGQVSQRFSATVVLDQQRPTIDSVAFDATGTNDTLKYTNVAQGLTLRVVANDGTGSGVSLMRVGDALDGSGNVTHATETYKLTPVLTRSSTVDGTQLVYVQVLDQAGNVSAVGQDAVIVDTTPPTGSITLARGPKATEAGYTNSPFAQAAETWADSQDGGVLVKLANRPQDLGAAVYQPTASSQGWFLDTSTEGTKTVYARFRDIAGNETTTPATDSVIYDITPPNPAAASLLSPSITNDAGVTLAFTTNTADLSSTQALTLSDEATFTSASTVGPLAFPVSAQSVFFLSAGDGVRSVFARFRDKAGNEAVTSVQVTLDTVAPTGSFSLTGFLADGTPSSSLTATSQITVNLVPQGATQFRLGDSSMTTCPGAGYSPIVATTLTHQPLPSDGVVSLCLRDAAGNAQGPLTQSLTLDTTAPTGCTLALSGTKVDGTAAPAGKTASRAITATIGSCVGATEMALIEGSVNCATASLSYVPFASSSTVTLGGTDGSRSIAGCVRDAARNVASLAPAAITLDSLGPTAPVVAIDNGASFINAATVALRGGNIGGVTGSAQTAVTWALSEDSASFPAAQGLGATTFTFGGTGLRTLYARFFDDVGNQSAIASAQVTIDVTGPSTAGVSLDLVPPLGAQAGFTNDANVQLTLGNTPADAVGVQVASVASNACPASAFTSAPIRALQSVVGFHLSATDGLSYVCVRLLDAAQNPSGLSPLAVTLDTVPPTAPVIATTPQLLNATATSAFTVTTTGAVSDVNFERYERSGGADSSWSNNGVSDRIRASTSFGYTLLQNRANVLQLRAVDKAGNVSPADSVTITWDAVIPTPPVLKQQWVDNGSARATVYWRSSVSPDVVAYNVYYGPIGGTTSGTVPSGFTGASAAEGPSPVRVASNGQADQAFTLSGLINSSTLYATVTAIDQAGNESPAPAAHATDLPNRQVQVAPNDVSPNQVAKLSLGTIGLTKAMVVSGQYAYLAGFVGGYSCASAGQVSGATPALVVVDLSSFAPALSAGHINLTPGQPSIVWGPTSYADTMLCTANAPYQPGLLDVLVDGDFLFFASGSKVRIFSLRVPSSPTLLTTLDFSASSPMAQQLALVGDRLFVGGDPTIIAVNLASLFDLNAATLPSLANIIGTSTASGQVGTTAASMGVTRDRLVQLNRNGGGNAGTLIASALTATPTFSTVANFISPASQSALYVGLGYSKPITSGNYLYMGTNGEFDVYRLGGLWGSTTSGPGLVTADVVQVSTAASSGAIEVAGHQLFSAEGSALRSTDLSRVSSPSLTSYNQGASFTALATYGNHLIGGAYNELDVLEVATPRTLHEVASAAAGGPFSDVTPGFLYTGNGAVHDLHSGSMTLVDAVSVPASVTWYFAFDQTRFDSTLVTAQGAGGLMLANLEKVNDRDSATHMAAADSLLVPVSGARITGVKAHGNLLIAAEVRANGVWLEVFDARALRNRQGIATFNPATASRGAFQVASFVPATTLWATVTLTNGRAVVSLEDAKLALPAPTQPTPGLYVVDLRDLLDDDPATSSVSVLASFPAVTAARLGTIRGGWLYAATAAGLTVIDVKEAMQEPPVSLPPSPLTTSLALGSSGLDSVVVYGSYLFAADHRGNLIHALDVHAPLSPLVISVAPVPAMITSGSAAGETSQFYPRTNVSVAGSRLYYSQVGEVHVFELE